MISLFEVVEILKATYIKMVEDGINGRNKTSEEYAQEVLENIFEKE